jgi:hypothetical protein
MLIGTVIFTIIFIVVYKSNFEFLFDDEFVRASMSVTPNWFGWEPAIGLVFIIGVILSTIWLNKLKYLYSTVSMATTTSLTLLLVQLVFIPKLEDHTQGPLIEMCEFAEQKEAILVSYGFKSYAPFFYGKVDPRPSEEKDMQWLLHAKTDKKILFVSKITNKELDQNPELKLIKQSGGYKLFERIIDP